MKPQTRPIDKSAAERILTLSRGVRTGTAFLLVMYARGLHFPWLLVTMIGMALAVRVLAIALLCQAGVITPWPSR